MSAQDNGIMLPGALAYDLVAVTTTTGGGCLSIPNPAGVDLIITDLILDVETPASGAATVDAGIAANGTTSADNLIDGQSVGGGGATPIVVGSPLGTNGKPAKRWGSSEYLTVTASATLAGLVGKAYVKFIRIDGS